MSGTSGSRRGWLLGTDRKTTLRLLRPVLRAILAPTPWPTCCRSRRRGTQPVEEKGSVCSKRRGSSCLSVSSAYIRARESSRRFPSQSSSERCRRTKDEEEGKKRASRTTRCIVTNSSSRIPFNNAKYGRFRGGHSRRPYRPSQTHPMTSDLYRNKRSRGRSRNDSRGFVSGTKMNSEITRLAPIVNYGSHDR